MVEKSLSSRISKRPAPAVQRTCPCGLRIWKALDTVSARRQGIGDRREVKPRARARCLSPVTAQSHGDPTRRIRHDERAANRAGKAHRAHPCADLRCLSGQPRVKPALSDQMERDGRCVGRSEFEAHLGRPYSGVLA